MFAAVTEWPQHTSLGPTATLEDYRLCKAANASYPVIIESPASHISGVCFRPENLRQLARILHFEDDEYLPVSCLLQLEDGLRLNAYAFIGLEVMKALDEPWSLVEWQQSQKSAFMPQIPGWMDDFEDTMIPELIGRLLPQHPELLH